MRGLLRLQQVRELSLVVILVLVMLVFSSQIEGYLAAGHAATITGYGLFEAFVERYRRPVVVAGFEPLDILAALVLLVEQVLRGKADVVNAFPRAVSRDGNQRALGALFRVFETDAGEWRGIARVPRHGAGISEEELAAHRALLDRLGTSAVWQGYLTTKKAAAAG